MISGKERGVLSCRLKEGCLEEFAVFKKSFKFYSCGVWTIGCVADVFHHVLAKVSPDGSLGGFLRIGGSEKIAHAADDIIAFECKSDDRGAFHEGSDVGEKGFVCDVGVMFGEDGVVELHHFDASDRKTFRLESGENSACEIFFNGVWFEKNECCLCRHAKGFSEEEGNVQSRIT